MTFTSQIIVNHLKKLRMIHLPNPNLIYHFFNENKVDLAFKFGEELFPPSLSLSFLSMLFYSHAYILISI